MARIKIDLPESFTFSTEIPIYIGHINYGHHLDNAQLISLVSEARVRYFKSMGYSELDVEGVGIVVADVAAQYRSEAFHGETLVVDQAHLAEPVEHLGGHIVGDTTLAQSRFELGPAPGARPVNMVDAMLRPRMTLSTPTSARCISTATPRASTPGPWARSGGCAWRGTGTRRTGWSSSPARCPWMNSTSACG